MRKPRKEASYSITGLKYAEATAVQGDKVTLLCEPEHVSVHDKCSVFASTSLHCFTKFHYSIFSNMISINAVKVINSSGQRIGHIAEDKAADLSPKLK